MKQGSNGGSTQKKPREGYYDYILRKFKEEESAIKTVEEREHQIAELKFRIHRLEEDMAHILKSSGQ